MDLRTILLFGMPRSGTTWLGKVFDSLAGDIRNAAYHLLWYARELTKDREPRTKDKHG